MSSSSPSRPDAAASPVWQSARAGMLVRALRGDLLGSRGCRDRAGAVSARSVGAEALGDASGAVDRGVASRRAGLSWPESAASWGWICSCAPLRKRAYLVRVSPPGSRPDSPFPAAGRGRAHPARARHLGA